MLAMSFPSQGLMSIYRNPIEEVSRFFNEKYKGRYRIYNCCSKYITSRGGDNTCYYCVRFIIIYGVSSLAMGQITCIPW